MIVATQDLTRSFADHVAVDHLNLNIDAGEIFGLLGPNGAGKSTTIKMLITLLPPTAGTAQVAGFDVVRDAREVRRRIGYVPQLVSADGGLTAYENLKLSATLHGLHGAPLRQSIGEALALMGLGEVGGALVKTYSGGMIRRLELAQAMLHHPRVLFLDEPTIGLDPVARRVVWDKLLDLRREFSTTVVVTTHDMDEADHLCDRLVIMHAGKIAACGTPDGLRAAVGPQATLDDVFTHFSGAYLDAGGSLRDVRQSRGVAHRLG